MPLPPMLVAIWGDEVLTIDIEITPAEPINIVASETALIHLEAVTPPVIEIDNLKE